MNTTKYLLAKYIPDMHRFEPRNIGVIVWSTLGIEARFLAENPQRQGEVDGRSIPGFVTSDSAYKQWIRYWREALSANSIEPLHGGEPVLASSPEFIKALQEMCKGNFVIAEAGAILEEVDINDLSLVATQLYTQLVTESLASEEPRDWGLDEKCEDLLVKTRLKDHHHFHNRFPVNYRVRGINEEYVFSHALANGKIECLLQRFPIPKTKASIQKSRDAMAWVLESLLNDNVITADKAVLIVDVSAEQKSHTEVEKTLKLLGGMSRVVNLQEEEHAVRTFVEVAKLP